MTPFDVYKTYLAFKNHFTKENYDYFKYCGKSRASLDSFHKRKDRYFFERTSRQKNDEEIKGRQADGERERERERNTKL